MCGVLGLALPIIGCSRPEPDLGGEFDGRVLVIGAGAAGLSAGYLLARQGVDVEVLEAAPTYGGRIKRATDFVDFPIPLGGEWLHVDAEELERIVADPDVEVTTQVAAYTAESTTGHYEDGELTVELAGDSPDPDLKLVGATWLDFFDAYVVPSVVDRLRFDTQVVKIDASGDGVVVTDAGGGTHEADVVVVTVPLSVLQNDVIEFVPAIEGRKRDALDEAWAWGGMKVFMEFSEEFYPSSLTFADSETEDGQRLYYDAAWGQDSDANVLGLFSVGTGAEPYQAQADDDALRDYVLAELDEIFDGAASASYIQHISQNWSEEPFINQAYLNDNADWRLPGRLFEPMADGRIRFAGEAYTQNNDWGSVHAAARAARDVVARILA